MSPRPGTTTSLGPIGDVASTPAGFAYNPIRSLALPPTGAGGVTLRATVDDGPGVVTAAAPADGVGTGVGLSAGSGSGSHQATLIMSGNTSGYMYKTGTYTDQPSPSGVAGNGVNEIGGGEQLFVSTSSALRTVRWNVDGGAMKDLTWSNVGGTVVTAFPSAGETHTVTGQNDSEAFYWTELVGQHTVTANLTFADGFAASVVMVVVVQAPQALELKRDFLAAGMHKGSQYKGNLLLQIAAFDQVDWGADGLLDNPGNVFSGKVSTTTLDGKLLGGTFFFKQLVLL